jgi:hypothetical protein
MTSTYANIIQSNLTKLFALDLDERAASLPARIEDKALTFNAFGAQCRLSAEALTLDGRKEDGPKGIITSLYALHAVEEEMLLEPFNAFKDIPNSAPYAAAFANRTQQALVPTVTRLKDSLAKIHARLAGSDPPASVSADIAFVVRPLPKIALCYLCYLPDEEFPAGVTCLYSHNAHRFLPTDALADVGEYTSQTILALLG